MIYFDHNATTPLDEQVLDVMLPFLTTLYANPSSLYRSARIARSAIDTARQQLAELVSVAPKQVLFTSGGTEANNLAIKGGFSCLKSCQKKIAVGAFEHPSVLETALSMRQQGTTVTTISINEDGRFSVAHVQALLATGVDAISLMLANNETGVIQDIAALALSVQADDILFHTDAVQAAGKIPLDFNQLGVNLMSISSHKIYGPKGCGALITDSKTQLTPLLTGGRQEQAVRAGTENVAAIVGFGKAAELARSRLQHESLHLKKLAKQLQAALETIEGLLIFGKNASRLSNTVQFGIPGTDGEMLLMQLDGKGFAVSSGSACASGGGEPSHVLQAMGVPDSLAKSAIRVSLGLANTEAQINHFVAALKSLLIAPN